MMMFKKSKGGRNSNPLKKTQGGFLAVLFLISFFIVPQAYSGAPAIPETTCDPQYYESLAARGWLEGQREITQNKNLIFKLDTILLMVCFDGYVADLANEATNMFSETTRWGQILKNTSMDDALEKLVMDATFAYMGNNFAHGGWLGGRSARGASLSSGGYNCDEMQKVWNEAKCMNTWHTPEEDGFFTFSAYRDDEDKRFLPDRCEKPALDWANNIKTATTAVPWVEDTVTTYLSLMDPANCSALTPKIKTGIQIKRTQQTPLQYDEYVCLTAGCHYKPLSGGTGTCSR